MLGVCSWCHRNKTWDNRNVGPDHNDAQCCLIVKIMLTTPYVRPNSVCGRVPCSVLLYVHRDSIALRPQTQYCFTSTETVLLYVQKTALLYVHRDSIALRPQRQYCFASKRQHCFTSTETVLLYVHRDSIALRPQRQYCFTSTETVLLYVHRDSIALRPQRQYGLFRTGTGTSEHFCLYDHPCTWNLEVPSFHFAPESQHK